MLRLFMLAFLGLYAHTLCSQIPPSEVIPDYVQKTHDKQYRAAYGSITKEFEEDSTALLLEQAEHLLSYFSKTVAHQYFGLKDVEDPNTSLADLRQEAVADGELYYFPVDSLLLPILHKTPANTREERYRARAHFLIGWYYYQVHSYFPHHWIMKEQQVLGLMYRHFQQYLSYANSSSWKSYDRYLQRAYEGIGYYELSQQNYEAAKTAFEKRLQIGRDNKQLPQAPSVYYNIAYCYWKLEQPDQGVVMAKRALQQYDEGIRKTDTYRLLALLHAAAQNWEAAERNYLAWGEKNKTIGKSWEQLLDMYLQANQPKPAEQWAQKIWTTDSIAPKTYETLIDHYGAAEQLPAFIDFLQDKTTLYAEQPEILGALYFFSADAALILKDKARAKTYLLKAKKAFSQLYDKNKAAQLERVIDQVLKDL